MFPTFLGGVQQIEKVSSIFFHFLAVVVHFSWTFQFYNSSKQDNHVKMAS